MTNSLEIIFIRNVTTEPSEYQFENRFAELPITINEPLFYEIQIGQSIHTFLINETLLFVLIIDFKNKIKT